LSVSLAYAHLPRLPALVAPPRVAGDDHPVAFFGVEDLDFILR